jgi:hypothetical protein
MPIVAVFHPWNNLTPKLGARMLTTLRCAGCRQIKFETFCNVAIKAGLILSVGCLVVSLITRYSNPALPSQGMAVDRRAA